MRNTTNIALVCFIYVVAITLSGCYYDKEDLLYHLPATTNCNTINAKFSVDIAPLMQSKCATSGCHDAATAAGGTVLETYTQVADKAGRINQRCVIDKTMPPNGALTTTEISNLSCWISSGTPNN
jgi:uncharacterized membrane protein